MATIQKIAWSNKSTYYGPVKDGKTAGKGVIDFSTAEVIDSNGAFVPKTLRGTFCDTKVTDAVYEFERQGVRYNFTGEVNELALVQGTLTIKNNRPWSFNGSSTGMKLVTGILTHPDIENGAAISVHNLNIMYFDVTAIKSIASLVWAAGVGAVIAVGNRTYTAPGHIVEVSESIIYDGDCEITEDDKIVFTGSGKKIYVEKDIVLEGEFEDGAFKSGTLIVNGAKIPIVSVDDDGDLIVDAELFA